jgi:hypothetical protein
VNFTKTGVLDHVEPGRTARFHLADDPQIQPCPDPDTVGTQLRVPPDGPQVVPTVSRVPAYRGTRLGHGPSAARSSSSSRGLR